MQKKDPDTPQRGWGNPVGHVTHDRLGVRAPYYYDKKGKQFVTSYQGEKLEAKDAETMEAALLALIKKVHEVTWEPYLKVLMPNERSRSGAARRVWVRYDRGYLGRMADGRWRFASWEATEERRIGWSEEIWSLRDKSTIPAGEPVNPDRWSDELMIFLPYREETWEALQEVDRRVGLLRERLESLVTQPVLLLEELRTQLGRLGAEELR